MAAAQLGRQSTSAHKYKHWWWLDLLCCAVTFYFLYFLLHPLVLLLILDGSLLCNWMMLVLIPGVVVESWVCLASWITFNTLGSSFLRLSSITCWSSTALSSTATYTQHRAEIHRRAPGNLRDVSGTYILAHKTKSGWEVELISWTSVAVAGIPRLGRR